MRQIRYVSFAAPSLRVGDLDKILTGARRFNAAVGATGMLLYMDDSFYQIIEGELDALNQIMQRIRNDTCHQDMVILNDLEIEQRIFPDWSMGFYRPDPRQGIPEGAFPVSQSTAIQFNKWCTEIEKYRRGLSASDLKVAIQKLGAPV